MALSVDSLFPLAVLVGFVILSLALITGGRVRFRVRRGRTRIMVEADGTQAQKEDR